ncbi:hypothetical protein ABPG77_009222 [Micractinium sp. CCAP 211/92]
MEGLEQQEDECRARGRAPHRSAAPTLAPRSLSAPSGRVAQLLAAAPPSPFLQGIVAALSPEQRHLLAQQLEIRQLAANRQRAEQQEWAAAAEQLLKHHHCHPELPVRHSGPHHPSGSPFPAAVAARPHGGAQHKRHWCEAEEGSQEPEALEPEQQRCRSMTAGQLAAAGEGRTAAVGRGSRLPWTDEELRRHIARLEREIAVLEQGGQPSTAGVAAAGQPACSPETLSLDFQQLLGAFDFSTDGPLAVMPGDHAADASHADRPAPAPDEHWEAAFDLPGDELWQQLQQGCQPALPHWHTQHWGVTRRSL